MYNQTLKLVTFEPAAVSKMTSPDPSIDTYREVLRECASFNLRKASRVVTQLYDDVLQPTGLRSTQVALLVLLAVENESSMSRLARQMMLSPSTLSRNLGPLQRDGLVDVRPAGKRGKNVSLTAAGRNALSDAFPYWQEAQARFTALVGASAWSKLSRQLAMTTSAARS
jgi:DNA-binding MarR family transcriptional regulator